MRSLLIIMLVLSAKIHAVPDSVRFVIIGDYGNGSGPEADVGKIVNAWAPDFIITTGDNNYEFGSAATIDGNVGLHYSAFIYPYFGIYGAGADTNRFFPSLGNHDVIPGPIPGPYLDYFTLPRNERYYDFVWGPIHFFALNSNTSEPDGTTSNSKQWAWLEESLAASESIYKFVYFHHPPYSSGSYGDLTRMQWPFDDWGVDAVFSGHEHDYERLDVDSVLYFVNGLGGKDYVDFPNETGRIGSQIRFSGDYGAMFVTVTVDSANFRFTTRSGDLIDSYTIPSKWAREMQIAAVDDAVATQEDRSVELRLLANDQYSLGDSIWISDYTQPDFGTATASVAGTLTYSPNLNFFGNDTLRYYIANAMDRIDSANVTITVVPVNDPPAVFNITTTSYDTTITITGITSQDSLVLSWTRATDVDGDAVTYHFVQQGSLDLLEIAMTADTLIILKMMNIGQIMQAKSANNIGGSWTIFANDGDTSLAATNGPFSLYFEYPTLGLQTHNLPSNRVELGQIHPNPFNSSTHIPFSTASNSHVSIAIYNILGEKVWSLVDQDLAIGNYDMIWDTVDRQNRSIPSGLYIVLLTSENLTASRKIVLLR